MINLQPIDLSILKELLIDGRKSFASIAKANGVSADEISNHYVDMEKTGVIVGATIQYNYPPVRLPSGCLNPHQVRGRIS